MGQVAALALNGVSDSPPQIFQPTPTQVDNTNDGYGFNLGTLFKGWELYNDTKATAVPTAQATAAGEKSGPNYLLYGGIALAVILLLRR